MALEIFWDFAVGRCSYSVGNGSIGRIIQSLEGMVLVCEVGPHIREKLPWAHHLIAYLIEHQSRLNRGGGHLWEAWLGFGSAVRLRVLGQVGLDVFPSV